MRRAAAAAAREAAPDSDDEPMQGMLDTAADIAHSDADDSSDGESIQAGPEDEDDDLADEQDNQDTDFADDQDEAPASGRLAQQEEKATVRYPTVPMVQSTVPAVVHSGPALQWAIQLEPEPSPGQVDAAEVLQSIASWLQVGLADAAQLLVSMTAEERETMRGEYAAVHQAAVVAGLTEL